VTSRSIANVLDDLVEALTPSHEGVRVTALEASVPFDMGVALRSDGGVDVSGDIPSWRWRTAFDREPGRLTVRFVEYSIPSGGPA
jgi:hypothetical protein